MSFGNRIASRNFLKCTENMAVLLWFIVWVFRFGYCVQFQVTNKPVPCTSCGDANYGPVADGVDFVDLTMNYDTFGTLMPPRRGSNKYMTQINSFEFWFVNQTNLELFKTNATKFMPKYGCFCAFALTGQDSACPVPPGYCLGPLCTRNDDGYAFIEFNGETELYCFLGAKPKQNFVQHKQTYIPIADYNWNATYALISKEIDSCFNTECFVSQADGCSPNTYGSLSGVSKKFQ
eukprot:185354_1